MDLRSGKIVTAAIFGKDRRAIIIAHLSENLEHCSDNSESHLTVPPGYRLKCSIDIYKTLCENFKYIFMSDSFANKESLRNFYEVSYSKMTQLHGDLEYLKESAQEDSWKYRLMLQQAEHYFSLFKHLADLNFKDLNFNL
jgi:hypothetical protein